MIPTISIYIAGTLTLLIAVLHTRFYKLFGWNEDFANVSAINAQILYTVHMALLLLFFLVGAISIICADELSQSSGLAMAFNASFAGFWLWRLIWQIVYFRGEKGRPVSPVIIFFLILFALLTAAYAIPLIWKGLF